MPQKQDPVPIVPPVQVIRQKLLVAEVEVNSLRKLLRLAMRHEYDLAQVRVKTNERGEHHHVA
jgi:hypothetical protein